MTAKKERPPITAPANLMFGAPELFGEEDTSLNLFVVMGVVGFKGEPFTNRKGKDQFYFKVFHHSWGVDADGNRRRARETIVDLVTFGERVAMIEPKVTIGDRVFVTGYIENILRGKYNRVVLVAHEVGLLESAAVVRAREEMLETGAPGVDLEGLLGDDQEVAPNDDEGDEED